MASSSQHPHIKFGEFIPETLSILKNAARMTHPFTPRPLSPQLRFSLTKKPRRTPTRMVSPPLLPHPTLSPPLAVNRSYVSVPAYWFLAMRAGIHGMYLSKDLLLQIMYQRWNNFRGYQSNDAEKIELLDPDVIIFGSPVDYFLTFPLLHRRESNQPPPELEGTNVGPNQRVAHVWATGPMKSPRNTLIEKGGKLFPWVANSTGTKMHSVTTLIAVGIERVTGYVECPKCGNIWGIGYGLKSYVEAALYVFEKKAEMMVPGNTVLQSSPFNCKCDGKKKNADGVRPLISDDFSKINWMCLYLGFGLGFCTTDQLQYYSKERKLDNVVDRNLLLLGVCMDIIGQVDAGSIPLP